MNRQFHIGDKVQRIGRWHGVVVGESFLPNGCPVCTVKQVFNVRGSRILSTATEVMVRESALVSSWLANKFPS